MESGHIGGYGERHAAACLAEQGWSCHRNTQQPGATDIMGTATSNGATVRVLVQVKTAVVPNQPAGLSADERRAITARAANLNGFAWLAQVQINAQGQLVGQIHWSRV
jgi:hypothetical protein